MYAELHAISNYSFLRGGSHPRELVDQAASLGYRAIALTDECSFAGIVKAHEAAKKHQIQLIVGAEFHLPEGLFVLLAPNRQAYGQISALISLARRRVDKGHYQLSFDDLCSPNDESSVSTKLSDCLLLWRPSLQSYSDYHSDEAHVTSNTARESEKDSDAAELDADYLAAIERIATQIKQHFPGRSYCLMERNLHAGEGLYLAFWQQVAERQGLACVAAGDVYHHVAERQMLQDVLQCIRAGVNLTQATQANLLSNSEHYLKPISAMKKRYPAQWISNGLDIAKRCQFSLDELKYEYPAEVVPVGMSAQAYLRQEVIRGALHRFQGQIPPSVSQQYERELALIAQLQYEYFFLTIYDIVMFAKQQGILHQGRGSAANSVVCYCLGITEVDPTKINMLFERFISKERNEPPDIDVDFEHERREEVIQYIYTKYGRERAALAATVISYRFKSAMGDVGKVLGLNALTISQLIKAVDRRDPLESWQAQLQRQGMIPKAGLGRFLIPLVEQIVGFPRHLSQHVGGFIISAGPLSELVPIENAAMEDRTVIQWDKDDIESLGLLKVDILALGMLTAIRKCFALLSEHGQPVNMQSIKWEQPEVYRMLQQGDSIGVFQIESRAQMSMLPRLKPASYYDLVIQIAIVRPGPIQGDMVHPYLRRRHGLDTVSYPSPAVEAVLSRTLGVPIFQEQVIQLAMVAAGFSGGEADQLRRAMASWKKSGELEQFEQKLLLGMASRGYRRDFAEQIYRQIKGFGEYGFPESHSASFALLAYVSAYLKCHYPAAFCCALLNSQPMGFYSPSQLLQDVQRHGVTVLPVCINHSQWQHILVPLESIDKPNLSSSTSSQAQWPLFAIRLGFCMIKGLAAHPIASMLAKRPRGGFTSLTEVTQSGLGRAELTLLASGNALSPFAAHIYQARWQLSAYQPSLPLFDESTSSQTEDINLPEKRRPLNPVAVTAQKSMSDQRVLASPSPMEQVLNDYQYLGVSLHGHPMALLRQAGLLSACVCASQLSAYRHGQVATVAGLVTGRQRPGTASGVTFMTLEDETGNINVVVWSGTARAQKKPYLISNILKVNGVVERQDGVIHLVAGRLSDVSALMNDLVIKSRDFH